jgi:lipoate-protein ligase A
VQKALISGDFFSRPQRLVRDLEAALIGCRVDPDVLSSRVLETLLSCGGEFLGISPEEISRSAAEAGARKALAQRFAPDEAMELFLVGLAPDRVGRLRADWLLLPYCAKPVACDYRWTADCGRCGDCQFGPLHDLADELGLGCVSIQSFEHLMMVLKDVAARGEVFVGSCCEAFYRKHRLEMEKSGASGVLVNLDSTTCYDLGKGMAAYEGHYDNQTRMNEGLLSKTARLMVHGPGS